MLALCSFVFDLVTLLEVTVQFQPAFYTSSFQKLPCVSPVPNVVVLLQKLFSLPTG